MTVEYLIAALLSITSLLFLVNSICISDRLRSLTRARDEWTVLYEQDELPCVEHQYLYLINNQTYHMRMNVGISIALMLMAAFILIVT